MGRLVWVEFMTSRLGVFAGRRNLSLLSRYTPKSPAVPQIRRRDCALDIIFAIGGGPGIPRSVIAVFNSRTLYGA
jgi:hypothetical protein